MSPESKKELDKRKKKIEYQIYGRENMAGKTRPSYLQGCDSHVSLALLDITPGTPYIY